ncbi:anti-sigma factor [Kordiimonas sediminis]|uniref:Anti-sigma factor n=1 Tax=Kordiimonas sediminis TaxID=1735581 RepID=A0A919E418_9PROT|nr:ChrR family anti-sigma-E factor [Kordiimonas sediminis]GHF11541.1 anti-sigma factor [Kordiimonas sediminis]
MKPHGLIGDEWLVSYAAGSLGEAHACVVAAHIDYHPALKSKLRDAEDIGGALLEVSEPDSLQSDSFDAVMAKITAFEEDMFGAVHMDTEQKDTVPPIVVGTDILPASSLPSSLSQYIADKDLNSLKWRRMGPGMSQVRLWDGPKGEKLWLLKARGGTEMPVHDHNGLEMTLVLQGGYQVGASHYTPGMIELADTDTKDHHPVIDEGEDCICLVVTEAPIKLHSFIGRLVQPFIGL